MKFLPQEEIEKLQIEEAHSEKKPKKTAEQIQAIYSSGQKHSGLSISWLRKNLCHG